MKQLVAIVASVFFALPAQAHDGSMKSILGEGYRIVAAYVLGGEARYILQKDNSVFESWPHKNEICLLIN